MKKPSNQPFKFPKKIRKKEKLNPNSFQPIQYDISKLELRKRKVAEITDFDDDDFWWPKKNKMA